jgi:hypothetical protein
MAAYGTLSSDIDNRLQWGEIHYVLRQTLIMMEFLKKLNIPYSVLSWSGIYSQPEQGEMVKASERGSTLRVILDSSTSFENQLTRFANFFEHGSPLSNYGTPLQESIINCSGYVSEFKNVHKLDIVNVVMFTDGDSTGRISMPEESKPIVDFTTGIKYTTDTCEKLGIKQDYHYYRDFAQVAFAAKVLKDRSGANFVLVPSTSHKRVKTKVNNSFSVNPNYNKRVNKEVRLGQRVIKMFESEGFSIISVASERNIWWSDRHNSDLDEGLDLDIGQTNGKMSDAVSADLMNKKTDAYFASIVAEKIAVR